LGQQDPKPWLDAWNQAVIEEGKAVAPSQKSAERELKSIRFQQAKLEARIAQLAKILGQ
jgi:hypothetical protein